MLPACVDCHQPHKVRKVFYTPGTRVERSQETYVILNNHYQGKAVANAIQLRSMTEDKRFSIPEPLLARYPQLSPFSTPPAFEDTLFRLR